MKSSITPEGILLRIERLRQGKEQKEICTGICAGFTIPVSQSYGAKDFQDLKRFVGNILWLASGFTLVITVLTVALCRPILQWMDTPADILDDAYSYIVVIFLGIPTIVLYNVLASLLRAKARIP